MQVPGEDGGGGAGGGGGQQQKQPQQQLQQQQQQQTDTLPSSVNPPLDDSPQSEFSIPASSTAAVLPPASAPTASSALSIMPQDQQVMYALV